MNRYRFKVTAAVIASMLAASVLAACSSGGSKKSEASGHTFVAVYADVSNTLEPETHEGDVSRWYGFERLGTLFGWNSEGLAGEGCEQLASMANLEGELAESWKWSDADKAYVVKLKDATSQFGNQLTSEDVKYTFDRIYAMKGIGFSLLGAIDIRADDPITVVDDKTFKINMNSRGTTDLAPITWHSFTILDSKVVKEHATKEDPWASKWLSHNTATFGPWTVTEKDFEPGKRIVLHANKNYTGPRGNITTFIMRAVPDAGTRLQLLQAGEAQYAARLSFDQMSRLKDDSSVKITSCASADRDIIGINNSDPILRNEKVRQAISEAIDRKALAEGPYRGMANPSESGVSSVFLKGDRPADTLEYNPENAKKLLSEAGYPDGLKLTLAYTPTRPGPEAEQTAIMLQSQLRAVGIDVKLDQIAGSTEFAGSMADGKLQMWLNLLPPAQPDVAYDTGLYYRTGGGQNFYKYSNATVDKLYKQILHEPLGAPRDKLVGQLSDYLATDLPVIFLEEKRFFKVVSKNVSGMKFLPTGELYARDLTLN